MRSFLSGIGCRLRRLGWPGQVGLLLLAVAAVVRFHLDDELGGREAAVRREQRALVDTSAAAREDGMARAASPLKTESFPPAATVDAFVLASHEAARRYELVVARSDLRSARDADARLIRHRVQMPVEGRYTDLRAWLAETMNGHPNLVLEDVELHRREVGQARVEGSVRLALITRAP